MIFRIFPDNVTPLWPQLEPLLTPALTLVSTHDPDDVRRTIMAGQAQLWCQMEGDKVVACSVTEFVNYPKGVFVRFWLGGALPSHKLDVKAFYETVDKWRELHNCIGMEIIGRAGWLKYFPKGRVEGLVMRLLADND